MANEIIFFTTALVDLFLVMVALRFGVTGLTGVLVANIILVSTLGSKIVSIYGFVTNAGNVFYACTFFAAMVIVEHYGSRAAYRSVGVGFLSLVLFVLMSQFTLRSVGSSEFAGINDAISTLFTAVPRIALGSMVAYLLSQNINIYVFNILKKKQYRQKLAVRTLASSVVGQSIDSIIFFTIAFAGILPGALLFQAILIGFTAKVVVGALSIPFLKLSYALKPDVA